MKLDEVPEGSFRACLRDFLRQGIGLKRAITICLPKLPADANPLDPAGIGSGAIGGHRGDKLSSGVEGVQCGLAGGFNPAIAQGDEKDAFHRSKGDPLYGRPAGNYDKVDGWWLRRLTGEEKEKIVKEREAKEAKEKADYTSASEEAGAARAELERLKASGLSDDDPKVKEAQEILQKANDKRDKEFAEYVGASLEADEPPPTHAPPNVTKPSRKAMETCDAAARFVTECNRVRWKSATCMKFLAFINKCGDPTITDPNPMDVEGFGCTVLADPEGEKKADVLACQPDTLPVPGTPCELLDTEASVAHYVFRPGPTSDPCSDPRAHIAEEGCVGGFTLTKFGDRDVDDIIRWGQEHLGGPVFVVPDPRTPGPDPVPPR
jgi:hypothetical protein